MTDKDALLREALEWLPREGFDDNLPELRNLRARITAALKDESAVVRYELSANYVEGKIKEKLIAEGWTPPLPKGE